MSNDHSETAGVMRLAAARITPAGLLATRESSMSRLVRQRSTRNECPGDSYGDEDSLIAPPDASTVGVRDYLPFANKHACDERQWKRPP